MKQWLILAILASGIPAFAQRDFLTSDEVEKVREAQEPNERLKLYVLLARQRLDQLQRLLGKEKKGRSLEARELLEDYADIIDALDTVSDDALKRGTDLTVGTSAVRDAENRFLAQLQKIKDRPPADLDLYSVALTEALAATTDSLDLLHLDSGRRAMKLTEQDDKIKEEAEKVIAAEDPKSKTAAQASASDQSPDGKPKRKPPTLYRPGEKPDTPQ
ncbi:MAG: hypothetical protein ABSG41_10820 [Bryobacteraceae bacterium]|jgi:hypothetical protein